MKTIKKKVLECKRLRFPTVLAGLVVVTTYLGILILLNYSSFFWGLMDQLAENISLQIRTETLTSIMMGFSWWGTYGTIAGWILLTSWFGYKRKWSWVIMILLLSIGGYAFGSVLKLMVGRERPVIYALVHEVSRSFPSLHMLNATIFYLTLTYFLYHFSRFFWRSLLVFFMSVLVIFTIGMSRVYLGVHYFSDIVAGFLFGIGYLGLVLLSFRVHELFCLRTKK